MNRVPGPLVFRFHYGVIISLSKPHGGTESSKKMDPTLDVNSPMFDAKRALYSDKFVPPKKVAPLDYLAKCRVLLPTWDPEYLKPQRPKPEEKKETAEENLPPLPQRPSGKPRVLVGPKRPVLDQIVDRFGEGPMALLKQLFVEKARVAVYIRRVKDIRGVCIGNLIACDKHFNLILKDVTDEYTVMVPKIVPGRSPADPERTIYVKEQRKRHLPQLFIKGDGVVSIVRAQTRPASETKM